MKPRFTRDRYDIGFDLEDDNRLLVGMVSGVLFILLLSGLYKSMGTLAVQEPEIQNETADSLVTAGQEGLDLYCEAVFYPVANQCIRLSGIGKICHLDDVPRSSLANCFQFWGRVRGLNMSSERAYEWAGTIIDAYRFAKNSLYSPDGLLNTPQCLHLLKRKPAFEAVNYMRKPR